MPNLRVHISAHSGGWRFQWQHEGAPLGDPIEVSAAVANQLGYVGSAIAQAFDHRSADGYASRPFMTTAALAHTGLQLRDLCCKPITDLLTTDAGNNRLTVLGDVPAALNLPWELLPVGGREERLGCHKHWGVFRAPADAPLPPGNRRGGPLRILFLAAAPTDQQVLDYEKEEEAILRATVTLKGALVFTAELGTYAELDELMQQVKPHIVHLSGHGAVRDGVGRFCFEDDAGHTDARTAGELAALFAQRDVPCVFLNGCQTSQAAVAGMCQALTAAGLPLALGWAASVADERATAFAETFYRELLAGEPVPAAAALARLRIQRDGIRPSIAGRDEDQELTFLLPQLYAARPVEVLFDPALPRENFKGVETRYELLPGGVKGLQEGFVGRRREQQQLVPALRNGRITFLLLHGVGGQGKSTLATRLVDRLRGAGFDVRAVLARRQESETAAACAARASVVVVKEISLAASLLGKDQLGALLGDESKPLARRLLLAADALAQLKCALVLDNFEDVLEVQPDGTWRIADTGLAEFYGRVQTQLTSPEGGRVVVTSRYVPAGTGDDLETVFAVKGLRDFKDYEFLKLLRRDERVARRIADGELPIALLVSLYDFAGGTPRFLERLRTLLRTFDAKELEAALKAGGGTLVAERDKYLEAHFGPMLFAKLAAATQALVGRLGLSQLPLPVDALADLTGLDGNELDAAVQQAVAFGLFQVFEAADMPTLYLPPGVWRGWLAERLSGDERTAAHGVLAAFWRGVYEKDREREVRVRVVDGLQACRIHAKHAGNRELRLWTSKQLARRWERICEWRAARGVLEEIPEADLDGAAWYLLASIDLKEGKYPAAREKFAKSLAIEQQIGDREGEAATLAQLAFLELATGNYEKAREEYLKACNTQQGIGNRGGEAATWHNLASIDLKEGKYPAAREKFAKSLAIKQQIGDRHGEATTWHQVGSIDLKEGNYPAAREKFAKSLAIRQQIGDRHGEAATWHNLASIDLQQGNYPAARENFAKALAMRQQIGDRRGEATTWHQLATIDLNEGNSPAAREKYAKAFAINQLIGDRQGEGAAFYQLGFVAANEDRLLPGAKLVGLCFLIDKALGHGDTDQDLRAFLGLCQQLELTQPQIIALLEEIGESYQRDRGWSLLKEAFPDWPALPDRAED